MNAGRRYIYSKYVLSPPLVGRPYTGFRLESIAVARSITVPSSMNTAVPAAETSAPMIHTTKVIPTLPLDLRMTLGAEKILYRPPSCRICDRLNAR